MTNQHLLEFLESARAGPNDKPAETSTESSNHEEKFPKFKLNGKGLGYLNLDDLIANYDPVIATKLIMGGTDLRDQVKRKGRVIIQNSDESKSITVLHACSKDQHSPTQSSHKRCVAAAGVYLAAHATHRIVQPRPVNPLAQSQGLSYLYEKNKVLYFLYNMGLEYEVGYFLPECAALLYWRLEHSDILYWSKDTKPGESAKKCPDEMFKTCCSLIERELSNSDESWTKLARLASPHIETLRNFEPISKNKYNSEVKKFYEDIPSGVNLFWFRWSPNQNRLVLNQDILKTEVPKRWS